MEAMCEVGVDPDGVGAGPDVEGLDAPVDIE
jgi:hypothetical protein